MAQAPVAMQVKVETVVPPGFPLTFANHTVVGSAAHELIVSFFQVDLPTTLDAAEIAKIKSVRANCVARIVLTPGHAIELFNALQTQLQSRGAAKEGGEAGDGGVKEKH